MRQYYLFGKETVNIDIIQKIEKKSSKCMWHIPEDKLDKNFIGFFTEKNECFDNCSELGAKSWKKYNDLKKKNEEKFEKFKEKLNFSIEKINEFINLSNDIQDTRGNIRSKKKDLENGFVLSDTKINGSKKKRRFKKDNRRFLTDREINNLEKEIEKLKIEEINMCKRLKIEETLEKAISSSFDINFRHCEKLSEKHGYGETVFLYNIFKDNLERMKQKVNNIEYNSRKEKEDIKLSEITIFEEAYKKVYDIVKSDKEDEEKMTVKDSRVITKKAKFYIDENGVRHELDQNINQVVLC